MPRNLRHSIVHWYTYRAVVGVLLGLAVALFMFWVYSDGPLPGGAHALNVKLHPEDRLFPTSDQPAPDVLIVGIDDKSIAQTGHWPFTRDKFAALVNKLVDSGAGVIVFDVGFSESYTPDGDKAFQAALAAAAKKGVPVILAYGQDQVATAPGKYLMQGPDQIPIRMFRCADPGPETAPCQQPISELAATIVTQDEDGIVRLQPMFIEPTCHQNGQSCPATLNPLAFVAYKDYFLGADAGSVSLQQEPDGLAFGQAWKQHLWVDGSGRFVIAYSGVPGNLAAHGQVVSFSDVAGGRVPADRLKGKIALVGAYEATGLPDTQQVPTGSGRPMWGVEIHANELTAFIDQQVASTFVQPEPPLMVLATMLLLGVLMGLVVARLSVLWGFGATLFALVAYTGAAMFAAPPLRVVPNLFHVWFVIALAYAGVTAYRFLYEDREKRKVTAIFGQYVKPELVAKMAKARSLEELTMGGERKQLSLLFVDIRGFTAMSETMTAEDVVKVTGEYLTDLTRIIFKWDGTVDKYVGDEIVAVWNAPHEQKDHALWAVRCAYDMIQHAPELQKRLVAMGLPPVRYGIGINTGPAVWGNMGSPMRRQFTALGDTVNTAARFCGAAGPFELLVGEQTYELCKDYIAVELAPGIQLKGKSADTFKIYKVQAIREAPGAPWVPWPTEMAALHTREVTQAYRTQQTILGAGATVSVQDALVTQPAGTPAAPAPEPEPTLAAPHTLEPEPPEGGGGPAA